MNGLLKLALAAGIAAAAVGGGLWLRGGIHASQEAYAMARARPQARHSPASVFAVGRKAMLDRRREASAREIEIFLGGTALPGASLEALNRKLAPAGLAADDSGRVRLLEDCEWAAAVAAMRGQGGDPLPPELARYVASLQEGCGQAPAPEEEEEEEEALDPRAGSPTPHEARVEERRRRITAYLYKAFSSTINRQSERGNRATIWSDYLDSTMDEYGRRMDEGARP